MKKYFSLFITYLLGVQALYAVDYFNKNFEGSFSLEEAGYMISSALLPKDTYLVYNIIPEGFPLNTSLDFRVSRGMSSYTLDHVFIDDNGRLMNEIPFDSNFQLVNPYLLIIKNPAYGENFDCDLQRGHLSSNFQFTPFPLEASNKNHKISLTLIGPVEEGQYVLNGEGFTPHKKILIDGYSSWMSKEQVFIKETLSDHAGKIFYKLPPLPEKSWVSIRVIDENQDEIYLYFNERYPRKGSKSFLEPIKIGKENVEF
ncbi:hypothetical protein [Candidatus Protochlamydia phocaeensis]|uniref:hypothetical protein n=1 Tax=Candidatus Protochlamydia phocaeensis TaxID=1414722 RepID=UPI000838A610|nr:hypothetical protein [Candidatus Protochlamydia phocaeensis]